jgi:hypothetical protein
MKPEITITIDEMDVTVVEVEFAGAHLETIKLSSAVREALATYFATEGRA